MYKFSLLAGKRWIFFFFLTGVVSLSAGMYDMALQAKSSKIAVSVIGRLTRPEKFENLLSWNENPHKAFTL